MSEDAMLEAGRRWREANPTLARRMVGEPKAHGGGGVGKHGQVFNIPNDPHRCEEWTRWEEDLILNPQGLTLSEQSARLGRSKVAITTRRWALRQAGRRPAAVAACPPPSVLRHPCWQPDGCEIDDGRCRPCEARAAGGQR